MQKTKAVKDAVDREVELGKFVLKRCSAKLSNLEKKYGMPTEKFAKKFEEGKLGDEQDFFEWFAAFEAQKHWQEKLKQLAA